MNRIRHLRDAESVRVVVHAGAVLERVYRLLIGRPPLPPNKDEADDDTGGDLALAR